MNERDFWTDCADAMELTVQGQRLIVREAADLVQDLWQRLLRTATTFARPRRHIG